MGRPSATRIKNFKKEDLALQFMLAIGEDTITSFSRKTGITRDTISRYIQQKSDCPPDLRTLRTIADHSEDKCVTFESLALDAGYTKKDIDRLTSKNKKAKNDEKSVKEKIMSNMSEVVKTVGIIPHIPVAPGVYSNSQKKVDCMKAAEEAEKDVRVYSDTMSSMSPLSIVNLVGSYDVRCQPEFYIFDDPEKFKKFSKLVILHGVKKAVEYATPESAPVFMFPKDVLLEYVSDRPIREFYALNSNRFGVVL